MSRSVSFAHNESYMLRLVTQRLVDGGLRYYYRSEDSTLLPAETGLNMIFGSVVMSIQTTPRTSHFGETKIVGGGPMWPELDDMYRQNVLKWDSPGEMVDHIFQVWVSALTNPAPCRPAPAFVL